MPASVLEVLITGDATSLKLAFTQATAATEEYAAASATSSAATKEASATATAFGNSSSRAFTYAKLGALAFAAVSVKAALDFNREFTLIAAVTNTAADQIDSLKTTVLGLSHETAVAPTELAHALYFLASAGLTSTQQMQALNATAHGVAVGLGTAGDLARITANALNAFGDQGLTATQVMDTLTAAIREGTAEPDEFAGALGRVLPIADNAGISFQAVAASLATMSNAGLDVNEGVTALRAILQSLIAPTAQTTSAFSTMGLTVTDVVASMQGQGLIATLRLVSDRARQVTNSTGEYNQLLRHAIPNIRGLAGALNLTGQDAAKVDEIFNQVTNSTGDLAKAFQTTAQSDAFKVSQAINDIKIAGQNLASDVLPLLADGLGVVARNAQVLLAALVAYGAARFVAPMLQDIAAANTELAASQVAANEAVAGINTSNLIGFGTLGARSVLGQGASSLAGQAKASQTALYGLSSASSGVVAGIAKLGNAIESKGLPQLFALVQGVIDAKNELDALKTEGISGALQSVAASGSASLFSQVPVVGSVLKSFQDALGTGDATKHFEDGINAVNLALTEAAKTAPEKTAIINSAIDSIGGSLSTDNIDQYVTAVQNQLDAEAQQKAQADATAAANLELTKQTQAATEATSSWQQQTAAMTEHLRGLARIGIDVNAFMAKLKTDLAASDDQTKTFADAVDTVTQAWDSFKTQAQQALFFIPGALDDVTSAAQQAQDSLANLAPPAKDLHGQDLVDYNNNLADLQAQANLTGDDILAAFQKANAESKTFFNNLLEISHIGGKAGKDLASSLLTAGNTLAASTIADAPLKLQKQIIATFGTGEDMAAKFATKLTDSIVGPLDDITTILAKIGKSLGVTNLDMYLNDHKAKKKVDDVASSIHQLTDRQHEVGVDLKAQRAQEQVDHMHDSIHNLTDAPHNVPLAVDTAKVEHQLTTFDNHLDRLTSKEHLIKVGVHIFPKSPWPDEALKQHVFDPVKQAGGKRINGQWTIPLDVTVHASLGGDVGGIMGSLGGDLAGIGAKFIGGPTKAEIEARKQWFADALAFATTNVPRLPRGHTNISVNHHEGRRREVVLDRKRFTDSASYDIDYARGF